MPTDCEPFTEVVSESPDYIAVRWPSKCMYEKSLILRARVIAQTCVKDRNFKELCINNRNCGGCSKNAK